MILFILNFILLLFISVLSSLKNEAMCYPTKPQCSFSKQYLLINPNQDGSNKPISWFDAKQECIKQFGSQSTLAYIDRSLDIPVINQFKAMKEVCHKDPFKAHNCWIGGYRSEENSDEWHFEDTSNNIAFKIYNDKQKNLDLYNIKDQTFNFWSCDPKNPNQCEPDNNNMMYLRYTANTDMDISQFEEKCLALFSSRDYNMSDWPCNGGDISNKNLIVSNILCMNPEYDIEKACQCDCEVCYIHGDPHIHTFDATSYHPMGNCTYNYVTPCYYNDFNELFPFDVSGDHANCFKSDMSCLKSLYITLYDPEYFKETKNPALRIELGNQLMMDPDSINNNNEKYWMTIAKYFPCKECKYNELMGNIEFDKDIIYYENNPNKEEPWLFRLQRSEDNQYIILRVYGKTEYELLRIEMRDITNTEEMSLYLSDARIYLNHCFLKESCGLCGYYDLNDYNDFVIRVDEDNNPNYYDGLPDFEHYISTENVDNIKDIAAYTRSQDFADFWRNDYEEFLRLHPICGKSKVCNFNDYTGFCPQYCDCVEENGETIRVLESNLPSLRDSCAIDICGCVNMEPEEIDEKFNVLEEFGMTAQEILDTISNEPNKNQELVGQFLVFIGKIECFNIAAQYCCTPIYCPPPWTLPDICQIIPTPFPTTTTTTTTLPPPTTTTIIEVTATDHPKKEWWDQQQYTDITKNPVKQKENVKEDKFTMDENDNKNYNKYTKDDYYEYLRKYYREYMKKRSTANEKYQTEEPTTTDTEPPKKSHHRHRSD